MKIETQVIQPEKAGDRATYVITATFDRGFDYRAVADTVADAQKLAREGYKPLEDTTRILALAMKQWASGEVSGVFRTAWERPGNYLKVTTTLIPGW